MKSRNFHSQLVRVVAPATADTEFTVTHGLGTIPREAIVVRRLYNARLYRATEQTTPTSLTDIIGGWEFEDGATLGLDSGANALDFTNNGATQNTGGAVGKASAYIRASSQFMTHADDALLKTADSHTWAFWVYLASKPVGGNMEAVAKNNATGGQQNYFIRYSQASDRFLGGFRNSGDTAFRLVTANNFGSPSLNTWYFICYWFDNAGDTINISVNNGTADSTATTDVPIQTTDAVSFGRAGAFNGNYWDGRLDQIMFWKRALTAAERTTLYNSGAGQTVSALSGPFTPKPWTATEAYLKCDTAAAEFYVLFFV